MNMYYNYYFHSFVFVFLFFIPSMCVYSIDERDSLIKMLYCNLYVLLDGQIVAVCIKVKHESIDVQNSGIYYHLISSIY